MIEQLVKIIQAIGSQIGSKATIIPLAMILVFMLSTSPTVISFGLCVGIITGLAVATILLQFFIDYKNKE